MVSLVAICRQILSNSLSLCNEKTGLNIAVFYLFITRISYPVDCVSCKADFSVIYKNMMKF